MCFHNFSFSRLSLHTHHLIYAVSAWHFHTVKKNCHFDYYNSCLLSDDEHVTYTWTKLDGMKLWRELVNNIITVEGVGQECRKHIKTVALCIF